MKKKLLFLCGWMLLVMSVWAQSRDGVFVWVEGGNTCYQLSQHPQVKTQDGEAILYVDGKEVLRLKVTENHPLSISLGEYRDTPSGIEDAVQDTQRVQKVGKYIIGGRLIIIKDGVRYDAEGRKLSNQ